MSRAAGSEIVDEASDRVPRGKVKKNLHVLIIVIAGILVFLGVLFKAYQAEENEAKAPKKDKQVDLQNAPSAADVKALLDAQKKPESKPAPVETPIPRELKDYADKNPPKSISGKGDEAALARAQALASPLMGLTGNTASAPAQPPTDSAQAILRNLSQAASPLGMQGRTQTAGDGDIAALIRAAQAQGRAPDSAHQANLTWLRGNGADGLGAESENQVLRVRPAAGKAVLHEGAIIAAVLVNGLNTDLPGQVTARVSDDVYDSINGATLLIPRGSRLVGRYNAEVQAGQERVLMAFQRLILPDGRSVRLQGSQAADVHGKSGIGGDVNNHFFKQFGTSLLIAAISMVVEPKAASGATVVNTGSTTPGSAAGQVLAETSKRILDRNKVIQPTITVPQGTVIAIQVNRDMVFDE